MLRFASIRCNWQCGWLLYHCQPTTIDTKRGRCGMLSPVAQSHTVSSESSHSSTTRYFNLNTVRRRIPTGCWTTSSHLKQEREMERCQVYQLGRKQRPQKTKRRRSKPVTTPVFSMDPPFGHMRPLCSPRAGTRVMVLRMLPG